MTPFYIYWPLAILAFAGIDILKGQRVAWVLNLAVTAAIWPFVWLMRGMLT